MILDMATHGDRELEYNEFMQCYESVELVSYWEKNINKKIILLEIIHIKNIIFLLFLLN
jgi:hypothetical protein